MMKAVVFDLDGTLLNTVEDLAQSTNVALQALSFKPHPLKQYYSFVGNGIDRLIERASGQAMGTPLFEEVKRLFMDHYRQHSMDKTAPYPGMQALLTALQEKGLHLAVLSNKDDAFIGALMQKYYPDISFACLMGKREEYLPKPDPTSLQAVLRDMGNTREETVYVGDSDVDVQTAHNAGLFCIGVTWGFRSKEELLKEGADILVERPDEIEKWIMEHEL